MTFTSPLLLLLLLILPLVAWMGWPSHGLGRSRESLSLFLRLIIVVCLVFAIAGLEIVQQGRNLAVVFLVDVSDSMPRPAIGAEIEYVRNAIQAAGPDDRSAVVLFGADALVERSMSAGRELGAVTSTPVTNQTDLAGAMRLGLALFPSEAARRMVILSDGGQTSGDAVAAAELAAASGVQIVSVPFVNQPGSEASVTAVDAPASLRSGDKFDLNVSIQASQAEPSVVRVLVGDKIVYEQTRVLRPGLQTFSLPLVAGAPGFVNYAVQIAPQKDVYYQNNQMDAFSQVLGPPRILLVAPAAGMAEPNGLPRPDEYSALLQALRAGGFSVDLSTPDLMPATRAGIAQYNSVVLVDVPASMLTIGQMENIQTYVRDLGGGLVAVGGPTSYGVGGYYDTPLEAALPVDMQIKDEKRRPSLAIVFIIDHSGSMSETSGGVEKLELAKEAAARSVQLLFPTDRVGVITFDDTASWVVPMTDLSKSRAVLAAIGSIQVGGGTDILAGVQAMAAVLPSDPAKVKHVILLTDGGADPAGIPELVKQLNSGDNITFSTVAVGRDAAPFLKDLAVIGGGRYHFTTDAGSIPSIFTEETTLAMRAYIVEQPFVPKLANPSPILAGIQAVPHLYGFVATSPKDLAQVILQSDKGDPILAAWQYGLGRSVAFTSDATGHWGRDWVQWQGFATFWAQAVRYTLGDLSDTALEMNVGLDGNQAKQARLTLDVRGRAGEFLNGYQILSNVVAPNGEVQAVTLRQVAPGRYETFFDPKEQGVYLMRFSGQPADGKSGESFAQTTGWTLSYSPEYRSIASNPDLLLRLAAITGGNVASANPADAFLHNLEASRAASLIWPWLLGLAALLLPLDVASRRLILTRQDLAHFSQVLKTRLQPRKSSGAAVAAQSPQMAALFQAKDRAHDGLKTAPEDTLASKIGQAAAIENLSVEPPALIPPPAEVQPANSPEAPATTAASLLAHKKTLRNKRG